MSVGNGSIQGSLRDALDIAIREVMLTLNTHAVGRIESFNAQNQTAQISIMYQRTLLDANNKPMPVNYPPLADVPVVFLGGGASYLSFPVSAGDECILLFNDRDIDGWFTSGQIAQLQSNRLHSMADAVAIVGLRNSQRVISGFDQNRAVLAFGTTMVGVGNSLVKVANQTTTLGTILQNLMTALAALTVNTSSGALNPTSVTQLQNVATQLQGLLE